MANKTFKVKHVKGDLIALALSGEFDVLVHGCNCFHVMGAGVAKSIKEKFPEAYDADLETKKGDINKLGTCSYGLHELGEGKYVTVVNAYTQWRYGRGEAHIDYAALANCMQWVNTRFIGSTVGLPHIGAGLAGGDWPTLLEIIKTKLVHVKATVVEYSGKSEATGGG